MPDASILPPPQIVGNVDVVFLLRRWWDPYLPTMPEKVEEVIAKLSKYWRNRREPNNFAKSYEGLEALRSMGRGFAVATTITELFDYTMIFQPKAIVAYNLIYGYEPSLDMHLQLTQMYNNIRRDSFYSHLPSLESACKTLQIAPQIIVAMPRTSSRPSTKELHLAMIGEQVVRQIQKKFPGAITTTAHVNLDEMVGYVNPMLNTTNDRLYTK